MFMGVGMVLVGIRSCGNLALQKYVAELRARGEPLSIAELTASYSPSPPGWITEFTNRLAALGPSPADGGKLHLADFTPPDLARVTWKLPQPPWTSEDGKQTNLSWLEISTRLSTARPVMRQLQKLLERPSPNSGPSTNWFDVETVWREKRSAAGWLACDTLVNLREGRQADALVSLRAIAGLARVHREDYSLAHQMCCVAVADVGLDLLWEALQAEGWSEEQLSALQRCWEEHDLIAAVAVGLQGERPLPLLCLSMSRERHRRSWSFYRNVALPNDALYGLRHIQREVELVRELRDGRSYREVRAAVAQQEAVLAAKAESATRIFYPITLLVLPAYEKAVTRGAKVEVKRRLAITAVALHRYHLKYGHWPRELAGLSPEFLRNVPRDCMDGQPLKYRVNKDGTFTLYSVGVDGIEQGGDPTPLKPGSTGLGDGLDAVWPASQRPVQGQNTAL